jgi:carbon-monoxide dehydrogenase medium subunit
MTPASFDYFSPASIEEALALLREHGDEAKILAGGQSLIPLMKLRFTSFPYIIDISRVAGLKFVREGEGKLSIGAMTTSAELENSELVAKNCSILHDACSQIADPLVRNMGTIGGNLSHGDPGNDLPAVMIALKAKFQLVSSKGRREVDASLFYKDTFVTDASQDEILVQVDIPEHGREYAGAYVKHKRRAGDFSVAGVAVAFEKGKDGRLRNVGVGLTSLGPTAIHAAKTESLLEGKVPDGPTIGKAIETAKQEASPVTDFYGTADYKLLALGILMERAIRSALSRTAGGK